MATGRTTTRWARRRRRRRRRRSWHSPPPRTPAGAPSLVSRPLPAGPGAPRGGGRPTGLGPPALRPRNPRWEPFDKRAPRATPPSPCWRQARGLRWRRRGVRRRGRTGPERGQNPTRDQKRPEGARTRPRSSPDGRGEVGPAGPGQGPGPDPWKGLPQILPRRGPLGHRGDWAEKARGPRRRRLIHTDDAAAAAVTPESL